MRKHVSIGLILLFFAFNVSLISQEENNEIKRDSSVYNWEKFSVNLGGFLTTLNNDISLTGHGLGLGININLEEALGLKVSNFVVRGNVEYNFGKRERSAVRVGYFGFFRNSSKVLESDISIGDTDLSIGTEVSTSSNKQIFTAIYDYSFYRDERIKLGASIGLYVLPSSFSISTSIFIEEKANFIAPLPVLGLSTSFFITPKLLIIQQIDFLYLETSAFKGNISDVNICLEYLPFKHFGLGFGYNVFRLNMSVYTSTAYFQDFEGSMKTGFSGLLLYAKYYF